MAGVLLRLLSYFAASLVFKILSSLGVGIFSMYFLNEIMTNLSNSMRDALTGLAPSVISILGLFGFDKYVSIVFGAFTTVMYLKSMRLLVTRQI